MQRAQASTSASLRPLLALLELVGAKEAPALLVQLRADLLACDATILAAAPSGDWLALRRASHNLTALAGTAGACGLHALAESLNRAAHDQDSAALTRILPELRQALAALVAEILALSDRVQP